MDEERVISPEQQPDDNRMDSTLRPEKLEYYVGQERVKKKLSIFIQAACERNEALDHVLLYGPPGLGKTTLAHIISREMNVNLHTTSGPAIERPGDLASILTNLSDKDILFIDEIHRLNPVVEEVLYPAMEDFGLDLMIGKGPSARSVRIDLSHFTLVGATTKIGRLSSPLRDRFGVINRLGFYSDKELSEIVKRSARILEIEVSPEGAAEIARRARGTPRVANRLLRRIRDFAQVEAEGTITGEVVTKALELMEIDEKGLDRIDHRLLETIIIKFSGGPVGLKTIAAAINEDSSTIEEVYEPYLLQLGFLKRTSQGREATPAAYKHMNIDLPEEMKSADEQKSLFDQEK